jgi:PAS domain-containing protein
VRQFGVAVDVTDRKRAEEELLASERQFRAVFLASRDAIVIADDEGRHTDVNPAAGELIGPPTGASSARQRPRSSGSTWLARVITGRPRAANSINSSSTQRTRPVRWTTRSIRRPRPAAGSAAAGGRPAPRRGTPAPASANRQSGLTIPDFCRREGLKD